MQKIFFISMEALLPVIFWGNIISLFVLFIYNRKTKFAVDKKISTFLIFSRLCHAFHYFVVSGRGVLPDFLSVNLGISMLYVGYYFEAQGILWILRENMRFNDRLLRIILAFFVVLLNLVEFIAPIAGLRVMLASLGVIALMFLPCVRMWSSRDAGIYTKSVAGFYAAYLLLLVVRVYYGLLDPNMGILTNNILQSATFLILFLQLIVTLPLYLLIVKDHADEALFLMATTDKLTGATNRHAFLDAATAVYKNCRSLRRSLSVLFLDIDHFKEVNDQYGHAFGDVVLARVAELIDKCLRESDLSCRYGGEEFVVLMANTNNDSAQAVAERILKEVSQSRFEENPDFSFTVSIGVYSGIPSLAQDFDTAVNLADEAMYRAKQSGRNQVVVFSSF